MSTHTIPIIPSIAPLAQDTEAWISDIWGVLHNGMEAFPPAGEACVTYRKRGGTVVLVTNAPYPEAFVARMLNDFRIPREAYDAIVTSGDVTRQHIRAHQGGAIYHLGPDRYLGIFDGVDVARSENLDDCRAVVCTGLMHDERETPADYADQIAAMHARGLDFICANPDIMVERGSRIVYCAGALAEAYAELGGRVIYAGKPHAPVYEEAFRHIDRIKGGPVARDKILAIGDGVKTDILGAGAMGLRSVFVASALHVAEGRSLDDTVLSELFADVPHPPIAAQSGLRW
jgi:HAD superfamily hydrolase (TIGR01459 family)